VLQRPGNAADTATGERLFFLTAERQTGIFVGMWEENFMEELICHCFGHTASDITKDVELNGRSIILEKILSEKKAGACQCGVKNPKGR
jgi:hypothetical protein